LQPLPIYRVCCKGSRDGKTPLLCVVSWDDEPRNFEGFATHILMTDDNVFEFVVKTLLQGLTFG